MTKTIQIVRALAMAGVTFAAAPLTHAALVTSNTYTFSGSASVTDLENGPPTTTNNGAILDTTSAAQFNANLGVLTGVALTVTSTRQNTAQVTAGNGPDTGSNANVTSTGSGSSTATVSAPGISNTFSTLTLADSCTGHRTDPCAGSPSTASATTNAVLAASAGSLNSYVGTGAVTISNTASSLSASQASKVFTGTESTKYTLDWNGTMAVAYSYLLHADGSFGSTSHQSVLNLDFGTVFQNAADPVLSFSIYNLANANRTGLDFDSLTGTGNTASLSTNFSAAENLAQAGSRTFTAMLDTMNLGAFSATYTFNLSDADIGASSSLRNASLTLNLSGIVAPRSAEVPEPFSFALLGIGFLGLAASRRRKA